MAYSTEVYETWKEKQIEKYVDLFPRIKEHLNSDMSVLDVGIGHAWLEQFFEEQNIRFKRVVGIEPDKKMAEPRQAGIEYHKELEEISEQFDLVISFDAAHLMDTPCKLIDYVKENGFLLVSVPLTFTNSLSVFTNLKVLSEGEIGTQEKDGFVFIQKVSK